MKMEKYKKKLVIIHNASSKKSEYYYDIIYISEPGFYEYL